MSIKKIKDYDKIWKRNKIITNDMVGKMIPVHRGNKFITIKINENMLNHKLGEFAPTRVKYMFKSKKNK
tara:strand:+ start:53 stop:259 length:207 start_codon:yes stop_codon:yes gene_type:complete